MTKETFDESTTLLSRTDRRESNIDGSRSNNNNLFLMVFVMQLGRFAGGVVVGMSSPMIPSMQNDSSDSSLPMTPSDYSWLGSLLNIGAIGGSLLGGYLIQSIGRKYTAIFCGIPLIGGMLMMSLARSTIVILIGRLWTGVGWGIGVVVPIYISEISTASLRGSLTTACHTFYAMGYLFAFVLGSYVSWRLFAALCAIPSVLWSVLCVFIPESPRFLLMKGKKTQAIISLHVIRGRDADIESELYEIEDHIQKTSDHAPWKHIVYQPSIRTPLLLAIVMTFWRQFGGIDSILYYTNTILKDTGTSSKLQMSRVATLMAVCDIVITIVPALLSDKSGRKTLLVASGIVSAVSAASFGVYSQIVGNNGSQNGTDVTISEFHNPHWLGDTSLIMCTVGYCLGIGPVFWVVISEITPLRARGKAISIVYSSDLLLGFIVTKEFFAAENTFSSQGVFWMFSLVSLVGTIYCWFFVPETKGKTLEEIADEFEENA